MDEIDAEKLRALAMERVGLVLEGVGELDKLVGVGGMAAVYRATGGDDPVAVKLIHEHLSTNSSLRKRFLREATILDQVDHRNSVQVYGTGESEAGEAYFVMELLEGVEVDVVWKRKDEFPIRGALRIAFQVLDCLDAYHRADVLHRDLKPGNLFLTGDGTVKLIDFGLARFRVEGEATTKKGTALGTPAYMAPEQALGKQDQVDERTDVFGVGATLFALLTGRPLHDVGAADAALVQAATSRPDSLHDHAPRVPGEVAELVDTALAWDRADRFQSAAEMRDAVRDLLETDDTKRAPEVVSSPGDGSGGPADSQVPRPKVGWAGVISDFFADITDVLFALRNRDEIEAPWQTLKNAFTKLRLAHKRRRRPLEWRVLPHSFEMDGNPVWEPENLLADRPYQLYRAGFRRIRVTDGLTFEQLISFVRWLGFDTDTTLRGEDDPATRFRELGLVGFEARIVAVFRWGQPTARPYPAYEGYGDLAEKAIDYLHRDEGMWAGLENLVDSSADASGQASQHAADSASMSTKIDRLATDFLRSPKGVLSKRFASSLHKSIQAQSDDWNNRFGSVLADIWRERPPGPELPSGELRSWVASALENQRVQQAFEVLLDAYNRLEDPDLRSSLVDDGLGGANLTTLLRLLYDAEREGGMDDADIVADALSQIIGSLPRSYLETIGMKYRNGGPLVKRAVRPYLERYGSLSSPEDTHEDEPDTIEEEV